jgi:DNA-binding transcriptional regulator YbjK
MTRLTDEQRRNVIVTAAVRLARDEGLAYVTHGSVAKRCSIPTSVSTVRRYFPRKEELLKAVLTETDDPLVHSVAAAMGINRGST